MSEIKAILAVLLVCCTWYLIIAVVVSDTEDLPMRQAIWWPIMFAKEIKRGFREVIKS
jgi:hypothetical protein